MNLPRLTAESSIGPARQQYVAVAAGGPNGGSGVQPMLSFGDITGGLLGVLGKVPCLLSCGLPNALALAPQCGFDIGCWIEKGGAAAGGCISQCLAS